MKSFPESLLPEKRRPLGWVLLIAALMFADMAAPTPWGLCVLHLLILPLAWRFLHRRLVTRVTVMQAAAVTIAGLWHAIYGPILDPSIFQGMGWHEATLRIGSGSTPLFFDPVRLWTFSALMAAGYFHVYLRRRLRLRLKHQQSLQQGVRRRSSEVARVNHALRDEVARRQATQHRLDQSETTFQSIMERIHLQVARKNSEGVFTYANDPFCSEIGLRPIEVIGSTDADLYAPMLAARYRADDLNVMTTGQHIDKVEEHPGVDGRAGFVQVFKAPEYDQHGECIGVQAIFWDVTEKHRGAIELQNSEARKRALFDAAGDAVLLVDDRGTIVEANPAAMNLLQAGGGRLVGRPLDDLIMPVPTGEQPRSTHETLRRKTMTWKTLPFSQRHQLRLRRGDGLAFDSEVSIHPIPLGEAEGRAVIIRDITLQQQAFEAMREAKAVAEQANRTKTQFMAGISHELRTPLGGIRGLTELLAVQTLPALARRYVNLIGQNTELLHDAIEDILDFSAIEAGRVAIDPTRIDLHETVSDAFGCLAIRVADKPVRLCLSIDPNTPRHVVADTKRLRQIIVNLAGNAIKFTPKGLVSLRLEMLDEDSWFEENASGVTASTRFRAIPGSADSHSENGRENDGENDEDRERMRWFELTVVDTGIGIAPENRTRIFDAFEQADRGTNKRFGGTGLGLAIARGLAERMGGGIDLQSEIGSGSRFRVRLRLKLAENPAEKITNDPLPPTKTRGIVVVSVDQDAIEAAITETLLCDGWSTRRPSRISVPQPGDETIARATETGGSSQPFAWILTHRTADAAWRVRARKTSDRVLWLTRTGEPPPRRARREDTTMIEPVHPDELRRWLAGKPLRQSARSHTIGGTPGGVKTDLPAAMMPAIRTSASAIPKSAVTTSAGGNRGDRKGDRAAQPAGVTRYRLLVVDDSPTNRLVIHDQLATAGHHVITADDGPEAISLFAKEDYDCILMDLQMPGMDGTEAIGEMNRLGKQLDRPVPPVIALTAHVTDQHRRMCRDAGMVGYITKPIHLIPLLAEIDRVVKIHGVAPEIESKTDEPDHLEPESEPKSGSQSEPALKPALESQPDAPDDAWHERLSQHCGGDPATIDSVCEAIIMEVPDLVRRLDRAAADGNAKAFRTASHTLKSCLRYLASPEHNALASHLENQSEDSDWFARLHTSVQSESTEATELQELRRVQTIARGWVATVRDRSMSIDRPAPPSHTPIF